MHYRHPSEIMDEIARLTPTFARLQLREARSARQHPVAVQRQGAGRHADDARRDSSCGAKASSSSPSSCRRTNAPPASIPLLLTTGRILTQYNVGAQTRRTENVTWASADVLEIHPHDAEVRGIKDGDIVGLTSRSGEIVLPADVTDRVRPGVVYTTFHFPESGANVVTTENSDWATNCPGIQGDGGRDRQGQPTVGVAEASP